MNRPGFNQSITYFASIVAEASYGDVSLWSMETYDASVKWCLYFEEIFQQLTDEEEYKVDAYLKSAAGHQLPYVLSSNDLWCSKHKLFRCLLQNNRLTPRLMNRVLVDYLKMGQEDDADANSFAIAQQKLLDDLVSLTHSTVALQEARTHPVLNRRPTVALIKDEVEYFQRPESIKMLSCAQLLLKKARSEVAGDKRCAKVFVFKLISHSKRASALVEVMLLMMVPNPVCLGIPADEFIVIDDLLRHLLCKQLVENALAVRLWDHSTFLLIKVSVSNETFAKAYLHHLET